MLRIGRETRFILEGKKGVNHGVADEVDLVVRDPFLAKVFDSALFGDKQQVGQMVGDDAVDLFRHAAIEGTKTRFDVSDQRPGSTGVIGNLGCNESAGDCRVNVADDDQQVRLFPSRASSNLFMISAVCTACEPGPAPKWTSGFGILRSAKKRSDIASS